MRLASSILMLFFLLVFAVAPGLADSDNLPNSGDYFIVNGDSGQAMQPAGASAGQNVLMYDFNHGGLQKWTLTRKIDPITKKPTNRYTIRLAGENTSLHFQPHPVADCTAIVSSDNANFTFQPTDRGILIKSVERNGDALYTVSNPPLNSETHFGPDDGTPKFRWTFEPAN